MPLSKRHRALLAGALGAVAIGALAAFAALIASSACDSSRGFRAAVEIGLFGTAVALAAAAMATVASVLVRPVAALGAGLLSAFPCGVMFYWIIRATDVGYCNV